MIRVLSVTYLTLTLASGVGGQALEIGSDTSVVTQFDGHDSEDTPADPRRSGEGFGGRTTLFVELAQTPFGPLVLIGLRSEPNAARGFHASLGAAVIASPLMIFTPTGMVDVGLAYSLPASPSLTLVARVGPSLVGSVGLGDAGYAQAGAHAGVSVLLGSISPRLRLEYTARRWFVDDGNAQPGSTHGIGIGLTWGGEG